MVGKHLLTLSNGALMMGLRFSQFMHSQQKIGKEKQQK
jgi:hypothetical protein